MALPFRETNFQGDHFTFSIDRVNAKDDIVEYLGGAVNTFAVNAAFDMLLICREPPETLIMRQGARVMRREQCVGGLREWILAGRPADWIQRRRSGSS